MPIYQKSTPEVREMIASLLNEFESHKPLVELKVTIDVLMAHGDRDEETGKLLNDAIKKNGVRALGLARIVNEKDRVKGCADAEILLDADHWGTIDEAEQRAILDHELHHLSLKVVKNVIQHDSQGRPKLKLRKHDIEVGWFKVIAYRHGKASVEQIQAAHMMDTMGQYFWPLLADSSSSAIKRISGEK